MEKEYFVELKLEKNYVNFDDFFDSTRDEIYRSIVKLFKGFLETNEKKLTLHITAQIDGMEWETDFNFTNDQFYILTRDVLPYFEDNDEYEICIEIREMCKKANGEF